MLSSDKSQIIVLHLTKYGDSGVVVHCIDSVSGRSGLLVRGIGKGRNSSAMAQFLPLNILEIVSDASSKSQLRYLKEYQSAYRLDNIKNDIYKRTIALFISEVLYRGLHDNVGDEKLFNWIATSIRMLNEVQGSFSNFHLWWLVGFCNILGFKPLIHPRTGSFSVPENEATGLSVFDSNELALLQNFLELPFEKVMAIPLTGSVRNSFAESLLKYLSFHLGAEINCKSLKVLHDVMR